MATLILIFFLIALFHYLVNGAIIPSYRNELRFHLELLQSDLAALDEKKQISREAFNIVNHSIQWKKRNLADLTMSEIWRANRIVSRNPEIRKEIENFHQLKMAETNPEFRQIIRRFDSLALKSLFLNSSGWSLYAIGPFAFLFLLANIAVVFGLAKNGARRIVERNIIISQSNLNELLVSR